MTTTTNQNDIAVIGMSCRFPGAKNVAAFWNNLKDGVESISFFSDEEIKEAGIGGKLLAEPDYVKAAGILDDVEMFDPLLFGYSPREASLIDPQQRLFLECAWEALEDAACNPDAYPGRIGVFGGARTSDYLLRHVWPRRGDRNGPSQLDIEIGNDVDYLATRTAYKLHLRAPCCTIQTACSTSLVAVAMACDSLLSGQSDVVICGGASISLPQKKGYRFIEGNIFSPDGHCRAFDARARGVVFSNGVGLVVLKRLADALHDRDRVHAVIKGYALNNDGADKVGFTAPSVTGQARVIGDALAMAGLPAGSIGYVEAHGTGTELGDPIEIAALTQAFRADTDACGFCAIGSVKTNIGHTFVAAGVASLIKTVLALKHRLIPPSLNFEKPNPRIDFESTPFRVAAEAAPWAPLDGARRAGVSSFGVGGTNAHVVLEEPPPQPESGPARPDQLIVLSARTRAALDAATHNLGEHLDKRPDIPLADAAYTLQTGRRALAVRRASVWSGREQAVASLRGPDALPADTVPSDEYEVAFLFSGQGAQYVNMGRGLYEREVCFRDTVDQCFERLRENSGLDLKPVLYPDEESDEASLKLRQTEFTQPALFVIEYALARLFMSWGIRPGALIGHSIGEYAAACLAGVMTLEDALALVVRRGRLMQSMPPGSMLAVMAPADDVAPLLREDAWTGTLSIAAINAPSLCVVAGPDEAIDAFEARLKNLSLAARRLRTSHAFHSPMMEPIVDPFAAAVREATLRPPAVPLISNVTGAWLREQEALDPTFWARHIRQTVRFSEGLQELCRGAHRHLLELGPGRTLCTLAQQHGDLEGVGRIVPSLPPPRSREPDAPFAWNALGRLWMAGVEVDWDAVHAGQQRRRVDLPAYPFDRQRCWLDPAPRGAASDLAESERPADPTQWLYVPAWKQTLAPGRNRSADTGSDKERWLVFLDAVGIGSHTLDLLKRHQGTVVTVTPGPAFSLQDEDGYVVNPNDRADYEKLCAALRDRDFVPDRIVHLWSLEAADGAATIPAGVHAAQPFGFFSLVYLAASLAKTFADAGMQWDVITRRVFRVVARHEPTCTVHATVEAACRVIPQEYAQFVCRQVDLDADAGMEAAAEDLLGELLSPPREATVAYRGRMRWVRVYDRVATLAERPERRLIRDGGTYLVTGGLGRIGLTIARCLARRTRGTLALLTRRGLPPRETWAAALAAADTDARVRAALEAVREIEATGSRVLLPRADIADPQAMQSAVQAIVRECGGLDGVVHASGLFARAPLSETAPDVCASMFRTKVDGVHVLRDVIAEHDPDFCLLTSSLASLLGGLGYAGYAASNLYLDAFAADMAAGGGTPWICVNWDAWASANASEAPDTTAEIRPEEAEQALVTILSRDLGPRVVVCTGSLETRLRQWGGPAVQVQAASEPAERPETAARPELASAYVAPGTDIEQAIAGVWREMLGLDRVGLNDNFFELGGHSLLATQVMARLRDTLHADLPVASMFENPTVASLAAMMTAGEDKGSMSAVDASRARGEARKQRRAGKARRGNGRGSS